jgi:hypothetical protein
MSISLSGCFASCQNTAAMNGSVIGAYNADYIAINESGGTIMDCWILHNVYVESEEDSDGLRFIDSHGDGILVQGDAKIKRVNDPKTFDFDQYVEYHYETDLIPYPEFYKMKKGLK